MANAGSSRSFYEIFDALVEFVDDFLLHDLVEELFGGQIFQEFFTFSHGPVQLERRDEMIDCFGKIPCR